MAKTSVSRNASIRGHDERTTRATGVRILTRNLARTKSDQDMSDSILTDVVEISYRSVDLPTQVPRKPKYLIYPQSYSSLLAPLHQDTERHDDDDDCAI